MAVAAMQHVWMLHCLQHTLAKRQSPAVRQQRQDVASTGRPPACPSLQSRFTCFICLAPVWHLLSSVYKCQLSGICFHLFTSVNCLASVKPGAPTQLRPRPHFHTCCPK